MNEAEIPTKISKISNEKQEMVSNPTQTIRQKAFRIIIVSQGEGRKRSK